MKTSLHKKSLCLLLSALLLLAMIPCSAFAEGETHVVVLATSDLHGNVWSYSYEDNTESANNGMARLYTYIKQVTAISLISTSSTIPSAPWMSRVKS